MRSGSTAPQFHCWFELSQEARGRATRRRAEGPDGLEHSIAAITSGSVAAYVLAAEVPAGRLLTVQTGVLAALSVSRLAFAIWLSRIAREPWHGTADEGLTR